MKRYWFCLLFLFTTVQLLEGADPIPDEKIKGLINQYKKDPRGPYRDIRWFCPDGSINLPKDYCSVENGKQHARYKIEVENLGSSNHLFLGQILTGTDIKYFWNKKNNQSRLKQYLLGRFLQRIDDGWIMRRAQYYRGAVQMQDEEAWGIKFFEQMLTDDDLIKDHYFLLRQAAKEIPHRGVDNLQEDIWAESKVISENFEPFFNLRIKMHGQPDASDLEKVIDFRNEYKTALSNELHSQFDQLIANMTELYKKVDLSVLTLYSRRLPRNSFVYTEIEDYIDTYSNLEDPIGRLIATAELIDATREYQVSLRDPSARLALLDISLILEDIFVLNISSWKPETLEDLLDKICYSGLVANGTGFLEEWEWEQVLNLLTLAKDADYTLGELMDYKDAARRIIEWGSGMVYGVYADVVDQYTGFEPLASEYFDERIRNSILLELGLSVGNLGDLVAEEAKLSNKVMDLNNQSVIRGLNPGYALGELEIISSPGKPIDYQDDKIYVFSRPPVDLKPVAGILTVSEGNMVSHIQLLARNLGIPNAIISPEHILELEIHKGKKVFFAVSNEGTTILKTENSMTRDETRLFSKESRANKKIKVPVEKIDLNNTNVIRLSDIDATASGIICGPKAANLAELKKQFPENVVDGIVIPFGVFRKHMNQPMPGQSISYWAFLNSIFKGADQMRRTGRNEKDIDKFILAELSILRNAFAKIRFEKIFYEDLRDAFLTIYNRDIGSLPVFVRSDTNMEDLEEFTGAGLNKTIFNVVEAKDIRKGIREVWASPFTERSYKWRQKYLFNPENVFPSILIIPSVDVDYSGVLVTKGITSRDGRDLTVAFSRGAGGAVEGQAAESWLLKHTGEDILLSPARESKHRRLPRAGGTYSRYATFEEPILNAKNKYDLRMLAYNVYQKATKGSDKSSTGPFDIELGFRKDKIYLFQIRPFVENKHAQSSEYLNSITPIIDRNKTIKRDVLINRKTEYLTEEVENETI